MTAALVMAAAGCSGKKDIAPSTGPSTTASSASTTLARADNPTSTAVAPVTTATTPGGGTAITKAIAPTTPPPAGSPKAKLAAALLTAADVPGAAETPGSDDDDTTEKCMPDIVMSKTNNPDAVNGVVFQRGTDDEGVMITSNGLVGPSVAVATDFMRKVSSASFRACLQQRLASSAPPGSKVSAGLHIEFTDARPQGHPRADSYVLFVRKVATVVQVQKLASGAKQDSPTATGADAQRLLAVVAGRL